jgi:hypothetical protein
MLFARRAGLRFPPAEIVRIDSDEDALAALLGHFRSRDKSFETSTALRPLYNLLTMLFLHWLNEVRKELRALITGSLLLGALGLYQSITARKVPWFVYAGITIFFLMWAFFGVWAKQSKPALDHLRQSQALSLLPVYPDDLRVDLLCFCRGTTLDFTQTTFFLKLSLVPDDDTGIREIGVMCKIGDRVYCGRPMDDLSEWIIRTPFSNPEYPYKSFQEDSLENVSLWKELQRTGLKSGLVKVGWVGLSIPEHIPLQETVRKVRVNLVKPQLREPYKFSFLEFPKCEDVIFDRAFRQ